MFRRLFIEFFKEKSKGIYTFYAAQILSTLLSTFFTYFDFHTFRFTVNLDNNLDNILSFNLTMFVSLSVFFVFILFINTCIKNERINKSQTWRLVPINNSQFYLGNLLSSFTVILYYGLLDAAGLIVLLLFSYSVDGNIKNSTTQWMHALVQTIPGEVLNRLEELIVLLVLSGFFIYLIITFFNIFSQSILDFLPVSSNKRVLRLIRFIIICLIAWVLIEINNHVVPFLFTPLLVFAGDAPFKAINFGKVNVILLLIDICFLIINMFIFSGFFEAKERQ